MRVAKYDFGDVVKHKLTNQKGVIMAIYYYHTGCIHYGVQVLPTKKGGTVKDEWSNIEESLLVAVHKKKQVTESPSRSGVFRDAEPKR